jgi:YVTN family beta-propeller protein
VVSDPNSDADTDVKGKVVVIDNATNKVIHTIGVGKGPSFLKYNPSNGNIYVANENSNDVSLIITTKTNSTS